MYVMYNYYYVVQLEYMIQENMIQENMTQENMTQENITDPGSGPPFSRS